MSLLSQALGAESDRAFHTWRLALPGRSLRSVGPEGESAPWSAPSELEASSAMLGSPGLGVWGEVRSDPALGASVRQEDTREFPV